MKKYSCLLGGALLLASANLASAGPCADEIASLSSTGASAAGETTGSTGGIAKDGTTAPLSPPGASAGGGTTPSAPAAGTGSSGSAGISKDGTTAPLAEKGQASSGVATSPQDMRAQQKGEPTAAEAASSGHDAMMASLDEAKALDAKGDEAGCMSKVQEAKRSHGAN